MVHILHAVWVGIVIVLDLAHVQVAKLVNIIWIHLIHVTYLSGHLLNLRWRHQKLILLLISTIRSNLHYIWWSYETSTNPRCLLIDATRGWSFLIWCWFNLSTWYLFEIGVFFLLISTGIRCIINDVLDAILNIFGRVQNLYFLSFTHLIVDISLLLIEKLVLVLWINDRIWLPLLWGLSRQVYQVRRLLGLMMIHLIDGSILVQLVQPAHSTLVVAEHICEIIIVHTNVFVILIIHHVLLLWTI